MMSRSEFVLAVLATMGCTGWALAHQGTPPTESLPATVRRLSAELDTVHATLAQLQQTVEDQKTTIGGLHSALEEARGQLTAGLDSFRKELEGGTPRTQLDLRSDDGRSAGAIEVMPGYGYALSLSAQPTGPNVKLVAQGKERGGFLSFLDDSQAVVAHLGAEREGGGYLELMSHRTQGTARFRSARLGESRSLRGGALSLGDSSGKEVVLLSTTKDGCGLVLGDPNQMDPKLGDKQRGIVISVTSKGSFIQIDGKRFTGR